MLSMACRGFAQTSTFVGMGNNCRGNGAVRKKKTRIWNNNSWGLQQAHVAEIWPSWSSKCTLFRDRWITSGAEVYWGNKGEIAWWIRGQVERQLTNEGCSGPYTLYYQSIHQFCKLNKQFIIWYQTARHKTIQNEQSILNTPHPTDAWQTE